MLNDTDIAWCAGFFDGEGCVRYYRQYPGKSGKVSANLMCSVSQNSDNKETLEFFQETVGLGKLKGPYATKKGNTKHLLSFAKNEVGILFVMLKPYLRKKKAEDFERALQSFVLHDSESTEADYERLLRKLDKKRK